MDRKQKLELAHQYSAALFERHPEIAGIAVGGSMARGNDLPISDIDLWCFINDTPAPLSIEKPSAAGVKLDIEQYPADLLTKPEVTEDSYFCGFLNEALILCDRNGLVAKCQERVRASLTSPKNKREQLRSIRASVERNYEEFRVSLETGDAREACRASIFATWSLCDHMLTDRGASPGGPRSIARLAIVWPDAYDALVKFESINPPGDPEANLLIDTCLLVTEPSSSFAGWIDTIRWMFANGYESDAFHILWIALGLKIKSAKTSPTDPYYSQMTTAAKKWLDIIGWDKPTMGAKLHLLRQIIDKYCIVAS